MSDEVTLGKCPVCGGTNEGEVVEKKGSFACNKADWSNQGTDETPEWKNDGCRYSIYKGALQRFGGPDLTAENVTDMLENGSIDVKLEMTRPVRIDEKFGIQVEIFPPKK